MKPEHIIQAIKETAKEYERLCERNSDAFVVVMALRGVVARAERYEAQESVPKEHVCPDCLREIPADFERCFNCTFPNR